MRPRSNAISKCVQFNEQVLLAVETPTLGKNLSHGIICDEDNKMEQLKIPKSKIQTGETLNTRPLVRKGGVKRKLVRAVSSADPSKNLDIVLETNHETQFSNVREKRASIRRTKESHIRSAAVCSLYLTQREFQSSTIDSSPGTTPTTPVFSPNIPFITKTTPTPCPKIPETEELDPAILSRSRSLNPNKRGVKKCANRTNSCIARVIGFPEMNVREEIKWARRSIRLYKEFSQLSTDNRTDSFLNLDALFSEDFDQDDDMFQDEDMFDVGIKEEDEGNSEDEDKFADILGVDYILYSLNNMYRTTCPYKKFGESRLMFPFGVCCNETGDVFVSDWEAGVIYQLENVEDELKATVAFPKAFGMCVVGSDLYITSEANNHLYLRKAGCLHQVDLGYFPSPDGICYMNGYVYIVEELNNRICAVTDCGESVITFGDDNGIFTLNKPGGISVYPDKELLIVCDRGNKRISMWDRIGNPVDVIPLSQHPDCCSYAGCGILVVGTSEGEVLFIDLDYKHQVFKWTNKQLKNPGFITGVAVDNRQNVYICDPKNHRVIKIHK